jgi:hypothetical protein
MPAGIIRKPTPLTICLVVLGRHVERLEFLEMMFGDRPALSPSELFYQRMLAEDPPEAVDKAGSECTAELSDQAAPLEHRRRAHH